MVLKFQRMIGIVLKELKSGDLFLVIMVEGYENIGGHLVPLLLSRPNASQASKDQLNCAPDD